MERAIEKKFLSNCRSAIWVSYVTVRQCTEILINGFLTKKVLAVGGLWWVLVDISWLVVGGGGWWWIYFGRWWVVVDILWLVVGGGGYIMAGRGWWRMAVGGGIV